MKDESLEQTVGKQEADVRDEDKTQAQIANDLEASTAGREQLEREIEERRLYLESVLACAPDAIITLDAEHNIQEWNPGAGKLFGYTSAEAVGRNIDTLITRPGSDVFEEATGFTRRVLSGKSLSPVETVRYRKDGSAVDVIVSGSPILLGGKVVGVVAVYTDVTERKWTEEALRDSEERFRALSEASFEAIFLLEKGVCFGQNLAAEKMFGYTLSEAVGRSVTEWISPEHRGMVEGNMLLGHEEPYRATALRRDGSTFPVEIQGKMMRYRGRAVQVAALRDITARVQAEEALAMRVEQLTALSQASRAVTASLEVDQVLGEIVSLASKVTASDYATVLLIDEAGRVDQSAEDLPGVLSIEYRARDGGLTEWIARSGQAAIIDEIGEDGAISPPLGKGAPRLANPHVVAAGVKAVAGLPLIARDNLLGLIYLYSLRPGAFRGQLPVLTAFANQAAIAIQNAWLYKEAQDEIAERKRVEEEIRKKSQDLSLINLMNNAANRGDSLGEIVQLLAQETKRIFSSPGATAYLLSEDGERLVMQNLVLPPAMKARVEKLIGTKIPAISIPLQPGSVYRQVLEAGRAQLVNDPEEIRRLMAQFAETVHLPKPLRQALRELIPRICEVLDIQSVINVPLVSEGEVIGLLDISRAEPFTESDLRRFETIAGQLTAIVERKLAEEAMRASEEYARSIIENSLDTIITVDVERRIVEFNEAAQKTFGYRAEEILGKHIDVLYLDPQEGVEVHRMTVEQGQCLREVSALRKNGEVFPSLISASALRNARGELMGVMGISRDISERKRAEESLRQRNRELSVLNRAGQALTSSLDLDQILDTVLDEVRRLLNVTACSVWLIEPETGDLVCLQAATPRDEVVRGWRLAPGEGICGWVARHGESLVVRDAWADERYYSGVDDETGLGLRSILTMPLRVKEDVIGALQVLDTEVGRFDKADLELLEPLVASATIAIENARLYEETARRLAQTEVLREMMLAAASTLDFDQVLERTIEVLEREMGVEYLGFMLPDENGEFMRSHPSLLGFTPPPGGVFRYPTDQCVTGRVYRTGEPVILSDVHEVADYAVAAAEVRSELAVPVEIGNRVMAVLNLESSKPNAFGEEELAFYTAVARQLGVAMENARLYEQARQDAETRATLLREVNHRVKNNLTAIIGLLHAERRHPKIEEQPYQAIMQSLVGRVQGLATVHSMLSASEWAPLSLSDLVAQVTHSSLQMLPPDRRVSVDVAPSPVRVTPDQAHNLALVINELVTNSVKHGLREQRSIGIGARIQLDGDTVLLEFRDNGPGYSTDVLRSERSGVGFDLIQNIVRKNLRGELSLRNDSGAVAAIRFKAEA